MSNEIHSPSSDSLSAGIGGLVGPDRAVAALERALREGRVAHAYLFAGPERVGKRTLALKLAQALNCDRLGGAGGPALGGGGGAGRPGRARAARPRPAPAPPPQNPFGKPRGDPPPQVCFVRVTADESRLLPTIRSRCRRLELRLPAVAEGEAALLARGGGAGGAPPPAPPG